MTDNKRNLQASHDAMATILVAIARKLVSGEPLNRIDALSAVLAVKDGAHNCARPIAVGLNHMDAAAVERFCGAMQDAIDAQCAVAAAEQNVGK